MPNWWPFGKKEKVDADALFREAEAELRTELAQQQAAGVPRQALLLTLEKEGVALEESPHTPEVKARLRALDLVYSELRPQVLGNLSTGKGHEMAGRVAEAVDCYETAVTDQVATRFPYEHLRIIYNRQSRYDDALRICTAALQNPHLSDSDRAHFQKWADRFGAAIKN